MPRPAPRSCPLPLLVVVGGEVDLGHGASAPTVRRMAVPVAGQVVATSARSPSTIGKNTASNRTTSTGRGRDPEPVLCRAKRQRSPDDGAVLHFDTLRNSSMVAITSPMLLPVAARQDIGWRWAAVRDQVDDLPVGGA